VKICVLFFAVRDLRKKKIRMLWRQDLGVRLEGPKSAKKCRYHINLVFQMHVCRDSVEITSSLRVDTVPTAW
jgi:hypothetical protein